MYLALRDSDWAALQLTAGAENGSAIESWLPAEFLGLGVAVQVFMRFSARFRFRGWDGVGKRTILN